MMSLLSAVLNPRSLVIVGASPNPDRIGGIPIETMRELGFPAEQLLLVNPKYKEIGDHTCYPMIASLPWVPDLAVLAVSAVEVLPILEQAHEFGIRAAVIFAAGFAEEGIAGGIQRQRNLVEFAHRTGMKISGPNCVGHANFQDRCFPSFVKATHYRRAAGSVSIISQSGNMGITLMRGCTEAGLGLRYVVSTGNEACIEFSEYLEHFVEDDGTKVVVGYVEQVRNGPRFLAAAAALRDVGKPFFLIKGGRSEKGREATASHTAAMAGTAEVYAAAFDQLGILTADEPQRLTDLAHLWSKGRTPTGERVAIVSLSGAGGVILADLCDGAGLTIPNLSEKTQLVLRGMVPSYGMVSNPVDLTGQIANSPSLFRNVFGAIVESGEIDAVLCYITGPYLALLADDMVEIARASQLLTISIDSTGALADHHFRLEAGGIPVFADISRAVAATATYLRWSSRRRSDVWRPAAPHQSPLPERQGSSRADETGLLSEAVSKAWLASAGLSTIAERVATTAEDAIAAADEIGYPVVIKIHSADIAHKTEVGGVRLNVRGRDEARVAFEAVVSSAAAARPEARIEGVVVQQQIQGGHPVLVGIVRDPVFGPVLTVGYGGVLTEIYKDISTRVLPVDAVLANAMLRELKSFPLLEGFRGAPSADVPALATFIERLSQFYACFADMLEEVEINPVMVLDRGRGVVPVDALIRTAAAKN